MVGTWDATGVRHADRTRCRPAVRGLPRHDPRPSHEPRAVASAVHDRRADSPGFPRRQEAELADERQTRPVARRLPPATCHSGASGPTPDGDLVGSGVGASKNKPPAGLSQTDTEIVSPTPMLSGGGSAPDVKQAANLSFGWARKGRDDSLVHLDDCRRKSLRPAAPATTSLAEGPGAGNPGTAAKRRLQLRNLCKSQLQL
jgi:hypothetical protein